MISIVACGSKSKYYPGLFVNSIFGKISFGNEVANYQDTLILVFAYQNTGLSLDQTQNLFQKRAYLVHPDHAGNYSFAVLAKGEKFDFYFFAPKFISQTASFSQTIGVRKIERNLEFKKDSNWKNSYSFFIRPILSELLEEPRYNLATSELLFLTRWLEKIEEETL